VHQFSPANGTVKQRSSSSRDQHYDNANTVPQPAPMPSHQQRRTRLLTSLILITSKKPDERPFSNTPSIPQASIAESTQNFYKKDISTACKSFELSTNKHYQHDSPSPSRHPPAHLTPVSLPPKLSPSPCYRASVVRALPVYHPHPADRTATPSAPLDLPSLQECKH